MLFLLVGYFLSKKIFSDEGEESPSLHSEKPKGIDCESCGVEGCGGFAKGLIRGGDRGGPHGRTEADTAASDVFCQAANETELSQQDRKAFIRCLGKGAVSRYHYTGAPSCQAAAAMSIRPKTCPHACLGFGDCLGTCRTGAIQLEEIARIDPLRCNGCGECIDACPLKLITMLPEQKGIVIACKGRETGIPSDIQSCPDGCTACNQCVDACEKEALVISEAGPPHLSPDRCDGCGLCIEACPQQIIFPC